MYSLSPLLLDAIASPSSPSIAPSRPKTAMKTSGGVARPNSTFDGWFASYCRQPCVYPRLIPYLVLVFSVSPSKTVTSRELNPK